MFLFCNVVVLMFFFISASPYHITLWTKEIIAATTTTDIGGFMQKHVRLSVERRHRMENLQRNYIYYFIEN